MKLRRSDRELRDRGELLALLGRADACRLAFAAGGEPYLVTMNYGFEWEGELPVLYFHCAREGRKLDSMRANPRVCFELDADHELVTGGSPCEWGMKYSSIVGYGTLEELAGEEERKAGLRLIMRHYGWPAEAPRAGGQSSFDELALRSTAVLRLKADELCGKRRA